MVSVGSVNTERTPFNRRQMHSQAVIPSQFAEYRISQGSGKIFRSWEYKTRIPVKDYPLFVHSLLLLIDIQQLSDKGEE